MKLFKLLKNIWGEFISEKENALPREDENFVADTKAALISRSTHSSSIILYIIIGFFTVLLIWSGFALIDQMAVAPGKVIPSSQVKIIQSLDGGILQEINVHEGDIVQQRQILGQLDQTRYTADYLQAQAKYYVALAQASRLQAESLKLNHINFPEILNNYSDLMQREQQLFNARKSALQDEIANLQAGYDAAIAEKKLFAKAYETRIVSKVDYLRAQRTAYDFKARLLAKQGEFIEQARTDYNKVQGDLASLSEALKSLADKMTRTTLHSPVYGIVKKIHIVTVGGVVTPGQNIMEIVPLADTLLVQARVKPEDIAFIHRGQKATVRISAYDYSIYGTLQGKVKYISADTIEENNPTNNNQAAPVLPYYLVNILTDRNYLEKNHHRYAIMPGMTATVNILTGERTVLQYLLKPLLKAKQDALHEK